MATAIQILVVLIVLFNFFVLYMCAKRWRIVHVMFTFLAFGASIAFVFFATVSLKTRISWQKQVVAREKELEKEKKDEQLLKYGDLEKDVEKVEATIIGAKALVDQEHYDRGRIWNNCVPGRFDGRAVTVATSDPAASTDGSVKANRMVEKMILFAFKEREANAGDPFKVPYQYLGEFVATGVTETSVTLAPTLPLDQVQLAGLNTPGDTWVLYEVMPVDSYEAFLDPRTGKTYDREILKNNILFTDEKAVLDQYVYDRMPIREIQKLDKDFDPPSDRVWFKVKFLKAHTIEVDSSDAPAVDKTLFDTAGRALPNALRQGEKTSFEIGDQHLFDRESATALINDGTCEKVDEVFVRQLHNYEHHFHEIDKRFRSIADSVAIVNVDTANLRASNAAAQKQVDYRQKEVDNANLDLSSLLYEQAEVTKYRLALEAALSQKRSELSELYRTNNLLAAELAAMQQKIADDLNKQTAEPATEPISLPE